MRLQMPADKEPPNSQFAFVILAAKRARQLMAGAPMLLGHTRSHKPTRISVEELQHGLLEYDVPEMSDRTAEKDARRKSE
jgi:DNA-directed RNA polymerase omega subunit